MKIREAVKTAKDCIAELYADEKAAEISLQDAEYHDSTNSWHVRIEFSLPVSGERVCKSVSIDDQTGQVSGIQRERPG